MSKEEKHPYSDYNLGSREEVAYFVEDWLWHFNVCNIGGEKEQLSLLRGMIDKAIPAFNLIDIARASDKSGSSDG